MGKIALFIPKYCELWIENPLKAFFVTISGFLFLIVMKIIMWCLLDYKYWKMEKELKKRYANKH